MSEKKRENFMIDLKNVRYPAEDMEAIAAYYTSGEINFVISKLYAYRKILLDDIHIRQSNLENLDYIIYNLRKQKEE